MCPNLSHLHFILSRKAHLFSLILNFKEEGLVGGERIEINSPQIFGITSEITEELPPSPPVLYSAHLTLILPSGSDSQFKGRYLRKNMRFELISFVFSELRREGEFRAAGVAGGALI